MAELVVGYPCEEVGLVLHRIGGGAEPQFTVLLHHRGIVSCGGGIEVLAPALLKIAEFHQLVAHHVGMGGEAFPDGAQRVGHHTVPVFLMERHHAEGKAIPACYKGAHLDILLR